MSDPLVDDVDECECSQIISDAHHELKRFVFFASPEYDAHSEESQFDIIPSTEATVYNISYDYKSLMHYGKREFAQPNKITMEALDPKYTDVIGTATRASKCDYQKVCNIYGCKTCNRKSKKTVKQNGEIWKTVAMSASKRLLNKECLDEQPNFCQALKEMRILDCGYNYAKKSCCATCNAATP
ncbi:hypothetical protein KIN20_015230 [Parelaphostrongylus tenuis]|uniref:Peptidase M12A domain-containing protein n=1 Tax=Parelaphostrongylus tenuis TaxID=148309 RepID=A0AAD5QPQ6_PARTN|nr:hypothetical protein KIN20_015230 [Parelaphostrongylus tenuis]